MEIFNSLERMKICGLNYKHFKLFYEQIKDKYVITDYMAFDELERIVIEIDRIAFEFDFRADNYDKALSQIKELKLEKGKKIIDKIFLNTKENRYPECEINYHIKVIDADFMHIVDRIFHITFNMQYSFVNVMKVFTSNTIKIVFYL